MKDLEEQVLAVCLFQDKFREVSFLEPDDFSTPNAKDCFKLIKENKGIDIYRLLATNPLPVTCQYWMLSLDFSIVGYNKHLDLSLFMVESRFKELLTRELIDLSGKTKSVLERELLNSLISAIPKEDIFELSEGAEEYLGIHASDFTKSRIRSFLKYRDKRLEEIKKIRNECK